MAQSNETEAADVAVRLRVLVVDDDLEFLRYMCALLESWHYSVQCVSTATDAISAIKVACPDVVISDMMLPGMDGVELLKELRGAPLCAGCIAPPACFPLFILITGHSTVSSAVSAIMEGVDEILMKPFDELRLLSMLQRFEAARKSV